MGGRIKIRAARHSTKQMHKTQNQKNQNETYRPIHWLQMKAAQVEPFPTNCACNVHGDATTSTAPQKRDGNKNSSRRGTRRVFNLITRKKTRVSVHNPCRTTFTNGENQCGNDLGTPAGTKSMTAWKHRPNKLLACRADHYRTRVRTTKLDTLRAEHIQGTDPSSHKQEST
jgi:hypothetical protein